MIKKIYLLVLAACLCLKLTAQEDARAAQILDRLVQSYEKSNGIKVTFTGSAQGTLLLQGDRFYLDNNGVQSWFNGTTQWSYVAENQEVTVSNPSPEEILSINPYSLLTHYQKNYDYQFIGSKRFQNQELSEVRLTPKMQTDVKSITFSVSKDNRPAIILVLLADETETVFQITSYQEDMNYSSDTFVYPEKRYPNVEIIDIR